MTTYGSLTTFSPNGELGQITHAQTAAAKGATSLGIKAVDGVVITSEKKAPSPLIDPTTIQKVFLIDEHVGFTYSGLGPDARVLVDVARKECQNYKMRYNEPMPIPQLAREIAAVYRDYTQSAGVRPLGVGVLRAGTDYAGVHISPLDPRGSFLPWKAVSTGKNATSARTSLEKRYVNEVEIEDAIHTALITVKDGLDGEMSPENIEVGVVRNGRFAILTPAELTDYIAQI
jgi:20S proteasome subunit alpha 2